MLILLVGACSFMFGVCSAMIRLFDVFGHFPHELIGSLILGALLAELFNLKCIGLFFHPTEFQIKLCAYLSGILHLTGYLTISLIDGFYPETSQLALVDWFRFALTLGYYVITIGFVTSGFFVFSLFLLGAFKRAD